MTTDLSSISCFYTMYFHGVPTNGSPLNYTEFTWKSRHPNHGDSKEILRSNKDMTYPRRPVEPPALGIVWKSQQFLYRMFNHMRTKLCDQKLALTGGGADHSSNILAGRIFGWLLLIYSFHFWSALQPRCRNWFPQLYHFYFSIIRGIQYSAEKVEHVFVL